MRFFFRIIFSFFCNLIALLAAGNFIGGFLITTDFSNLLVVAGIFTLINLLIRPIISFILSPINFITLGLFTLVINGAMLYLLDILNENVTITEIESLIYGTILITAINFIVQLSAKIAYRKS